jgi:hypothetical protein
MQIDILGPPPIGSGGNGAGRGSSRQRATVPLDLPSHRSPVGRNRCGLFTKHILLVLLSLILSIFGGGMINRIRGGTLCIFHWHLIANRKYSKFNIWHLQIEIFRLPGPA